MKIVVLYNFFGGDLNIYPSQDYSGRNEDNVLPIINALKNKGHEVISVYADDDFYENLKRIKPDAVFNLCDEGFANNSQLEPHIPAVLDILQLQYTGANYLTLATCLNKARTKEILLQNQLNTPKFQIFSRKTDKLKPELKFPLIVKPSKEDASIGIRQDSVVDDEIQLKNKVEEVIKTYKQPALVEEYIEGREMNTGILGNYNEKKESMTILPVSEIIFKLSEGKRNICCYEAKWVKEDEYYQQTIPQCPAKIDAELEKTMKDMALKAYVLMQCTGYGRIDFRVRDGVPYILEVNPNPDISTDAGLARMAKVAGYEYEDLIEKILQIAVQKQNFIRAYSTSVKKTVKDSVKEESHANS